VRAHLGHGSCLHPVWLTWPLLHGRSEERWPFGTILDEEAEDTQQKGKAQKEWKEAKAALEEKVVWLLTPVLFFSIWESASLPEVGFPNLVHHFPPQPFQSKAFCLSIPNTISIRCPAMTACNWSLLFSVFRNEGLIN